MAPQAGMQRRPSGRAGPVSTLLKGCSPPEQVTGPFAPARTGIIIHIGADRPRSGDSSSCSRGRFCRKGPCPNPAQKQVPPAPFHAISRVWGMPGSLSPKGEFTLVYPMLARLYPSAEMWPSGRRRSPAKGVGPKGSRGFESHRLRHPPLMLNDILQISSRDGRGLAPSANKHFCGVACFDLCRGMGLVQLE